MKSSWQFVHKHKRTFKGICLGLIMGMQPSLSLASLMFDTAHVPARNPISQGILGFTETSYETKGGSEFDVERTVLAAEFCKNLASDLNFGLTAGYIAESEIRYSSGSGFVLGAGGRKLFLTKNQVQFLGFTSLSYSKEDLSDGDFKTSLSLLTLNLGPVVSLPLSQELAVTSTLDIAPFSKGESNTKLAGVSSKSKFERDSLSVLRFGLRYLGSGWLMRIELATVNENSIYLAFGQNI